MESLLFVIKIYEKMNLGKYYKVIVRHIYVCIENRIPDAMATAVAILGLLIATVFLGVSNIIDYPTGEKHILIVMMLNTIPGIYFCHGMHTDKPLKENEIRKKRLLLAIVVIIILCFYWFSFSI